MKKIVKGVALSVLSAIIVFNSAFTLTGYAAEEVDASLCEASLEDEDEEILLEDPTENEDISEELLEEAEDVSENSSKELLTEEPEDVSEGILEDIPEDVSENSSEFLEDIESVSPDASATSGSCGEKATWSYDASSKTLTIKGTGAISDYTDAKATPWYGYRNNITTITISNGITHIGRYALASLGNIATVSLGDTLVSLGEWALASTSTTELTFPKTFKSLAQNSLSYTSPRKLTFLGNAPTFIDGEPLTSRTSPTVIFYPEGNTTWNQNSVKEFIEMFNIQDDMVEYGKIHFFPTPKNGKTALKGKCGSNATWELTKGNKYSHYTLKISGSGEMKDYTIFGTAPWLRYADDIDTLIISSGITRIGNFAFIGLSGSDISIPASVTNVGQYAFAYTYFLNAACNEKTTFKTVGKAAFFEACFREGGLTPSSVQNITSMGDYAFGCFWGYPLFSGDTVTLNTPDIPAGAFTKREYISTLILGDKVKTVGVSAFENMRSLKSLNLGNSVQTISSNAFNLDEVKELTIPDSLVTTGDSSIIPLVTDKLYVGKNVKHMRGFRYRYDSNKYTKEIHFTGDCPVDIDEYLHYPCTVYYPRYNYTWLEMQDRAKNYSMTFIPVGDEKKITCTVTFVTNCDTSVPSQTVEYGTRIKLPEIQNGTATFEGWYKDSAFKKKFNSADRVGRSMTLYAKWTRKSDSDWGDITREDRNEKKFFTPADVKDELWTAGIKDTAIYNGAAYKATTLHVYDYKKLLVLNKDYTVKYTNNTKPGKATVTVTFKGNYQGTRKFTVNIQPINLEELSNKGLTERGVTYKLSYDSYIYAKYNKGKVVKKKPQLFLYRNGKEIKFKENKDYVLDYSGSDFKTKGKVHQFRLKGKGKYKGTLIFNLELVDDVYAHRDPMSNCEIQDLLPSVDYGNDSNKSYGIRVYDKVKKKYVDTYNYTVSFLNSDKPGTATIKVTGRNTYTGTITKQYKIRGTSIKNAKIVNTGNYVYSGDSYKDKVNVSLAYAGNINGYATTSWLSGDPVNVGTFKLKLTGTYLLYGTRTITRKIVPFKVTKENSTVTTKDGTFNRVLVLFKDEYPASPAGTKAAPQIYFKTGSGSHMLLKKGKDYTLTYSNNKKIGTGKVTIKFKGNFKGKLSTTFNIVAADIQNCKATATDVVYKKAAGTCKPAITVTDPVSGVKLKAGRDYEKKIIYTYVGATNVKNSKGKSELREAGSVVKNADIIPVGTRIKATITGKGYYGNSTITCSFRYIAKSLSKAKVKMKKSYSYTGSAITPSYENMVVTIGKTTLTSDDYEIVSYKNNIQKGKATMVIRGKGNYGGSKTVTFNIKASNK